MIHTAIILAGGFGTRLQKVVNDVPKPMAPVYEKPFLYWLLQYCNRQGINEIVLSVGYKGEMIENHFGHSFHNISLKYCYENTPLGTGGAIVESLKHTEAPEVFVLNGDSFFEIDLNQFFQLHRQYQSELSLALNEMNNFERYGVVRTDSSNRITAFKEKEPVESGSINGGIYILNRKVFSDRNLSEKFSFEKDFLEKFLNEEKFFGFTFRNYFIDIGIPEDYERANREFWKFSVDKSWTLFLDRDGVINKKIEDDYVRNLSMFEWLPGAKESVCKLSEIFSRIIVVTNQQGVGKGLMTEKDVTAVNDFISREISAEGGKIDAFYFAPQLKAENHPDRKPGTGMAFRAQKDFPEIDFTKSVIIGDSVSDMEFGQQLGMRKIYIGKHSQTVNADMFFNSLYQASVFLHKIQI